MSSLKDKVGEWVLTIQPQSLRASRLRRASSGPHYPILGLAF